MPLIVLAATGCSLLPLQPQPAVQKIYQEGVPHTDPRGNARMDYDPARSFFPIGMYHAMHGRHFGRDYDLSVLRDARFNIVHFWNGQKLADVIDAIGANGLQAMVPEPELEEVRRFRDNPSIWGWYLDEEPSGHYPPDTHTAKLAVFAERKKAIQALDPGRPVFSLDKPAMDDKRRVNWLRWVEASDIAAHFNYPVLSAEPFQTMDTPRGIPRSVALSVEASGERKPVFLVLQAFRSPIGWAWPTPRQFRAMAYAGIVHGATGVMYFVYDSFGSRDGDVIGIAPDPIADYGETPDFDNSGKPPVLATARDLETSRTLWQAALALNVELHDLAPAILSPTARADYSVSATGWAISPTPIRTILKEHSDGRWTLIAVNIDDASLRARFAFSEPVKGVRRLFDGDPPPALNGSTIEDDFPPFAVRVYALERPGYSR